MTDNELKAHVTIRNKLATLAQAGDTRQGDVYAEIFTEDCLFQFGDGDKANSMTGRPAIREWMSGPRQIIAGPAGGAPSFVNHNLTSSKIEMLGEDEADVRSYWFVMSPIGPDHSGLYLDKWQKVGDDWQLRHRRIRTLWRAENSYTHNHGAPK